MKTERWTVYDILPEESGYTRSGTEWRRRTMVLESAPDLYGNTNKLAVEAGGKRAAALASLRPGDVVEVSYVVTSREYNGKWYNDVRLVSVSVPNAKPAAQAPAAGDDDDLPI